MIRFENVSMSYGTGAPVLHDLSFEIQSGSFQFLTGPSGAGKTSLLRLLFMQSLPSSGNISLFGEDVRTLTPLDLPKIRTRIGIVFQDFRLLDHLTIYENVALPLIVRGRTQETYRNDVLELLNWVGLSDCLHDYPPLLSGGEKQRAAIARAVIKPARTFTSRRTHRQFRCRTRPPSFAFIHRIKPQRHLCRHRHP